MEPRATSTSSRLALALVVALGVLVPLALLAPALPARAQGTSQPSPTQESDNPINDQGSSYHYRTYITRVVPSVPGLSCTCSNSPTG